MNKFFIIIKYLLQIPLTGLYFVSFLFPRDKKIWVFGSWDGTVFCDNTKYFFLYISNKMKKEIRPIWLSKNKKLVQELNSKGYDSYYTYSFLGIFYLLRAKWIVLDHNGVGTEHPLIFWLRGGAKVLQLYHGTPLKKIGYDAQSTMYNKKFVFLSRFFLPWLYFNKNTYVASPSKFFVPIFSSAFNLDKKDIFVTGHARTDILFKEINNYEIALNLKILEELITKKIGDKNKIILYAPTFRDARGNILQDANFDLDKLDKFLISNNCYFIIKHHQAGESIKKLDLKRIIVLPNDFDLYPLLKYVDILINDYSSVFFDFLLLNRPIIFFPFDLKKYLSNDRELYFDYDDFVPGPKAHNFKELLNWIKYFIDGKDNFSKKREKIRDLSSDDIKGNYSKKVYDFILEHS
jgi:CDP-glycerol glycerophosphotransferase (TagB/SpsB family)